MFKDNISKHLDKSIEDILHKCETMASQHPNAIKLTTGLYDMNVIINYPQLVKKLITLN